MNCTLAGCLTEEATLLGVLHVLPLIIKYKQAIWVFLVLRLLASGVSASNAACTMCWLIEDEPLGRTLPLSLNIPLSVCRQDRVALLKIY